MRILFILLLVVAFGLLSQTVLANWTQPNNPPPTCNAGDPGCDPPVNVSATPQVKAGGLGIFGNFLVGTKDLFVDHATGRVGIGLTGPTQVLDVAGYVRGVGLCIADDCRDSWPSGGNGSGVSKIIAGNNISISPSGGTGDVTINATGGGTNYWNASSNSILFNGINHNSYGSVGINTDPVYTLDVRHPSGAKAYVAGSVGVTGKLCLGSFGSNWDDSTKCISSWPSGGGGDNLGDHTMREDLKTNGFKINRAGGGVGLSFDASGNALFSGAGSFGSNLVFNGELAPEGNTCTNGQTIKKQSTGQWVCADLGGGGDITGVTAGNGLTGGGTSGEVSVALGSVNWSDDCVAQGSNDTEICPIGSRAFCALSKKTESGNGSLNSCRVYLESGTWKVEAKVQNQANGSVTCKAVCIGL